MHSHRLLLSLLGAWLLVACHSTGPLGKGAAYGDKPGPRDFQTVVIDAGHGGKDSGARARGLTEKNLTLDIAKRLAALLEPDFRVILTRTHDHFVELDQRAQTASRHSNAVLVSIHFNYGRRWRAGPETYWWRVDSYSLARRIQRHLNGACPHESGNAGLVRRRLRLTRNPTIPCVLMECGYLTSLKDARMLGTADYRQRIAKSLASALREQRMAGDTGMGPLPAPIYAPPSRATDARG
jgi:N-acetylmuramoyl-L-alanine amidase